MNSKWINLYGVSDKFTPRTISKHEITTIIGQVKGRIPTITPVIETKVLPTILAKIQITPLGLPALVEQLIKIVAMHRDITQESK